MLNRRKTVPCDEKRKEKILRFLFHLTFSSFYWYNFQSYTVYVATQEDCGLYFVNTSFPHFNCICHVFQMLWEILYAPMNGKNGFSGTSLSSRFAYFCHGWLKCFMLSVWKDDHWHWKPLRALSTWLWLLFSTIAKGCSQTKQTILEVSLDWMVLVPRSIL